MALYLAGGDGFLAREAMFFGSPALPPSPAISIVPEALPIVRPRPIDFPRPVFPPPGPSIEHKPQAERMFVQPPLGPPQGPPVSVKEQPPAAPKPMSGAVVLLLLVPVFFLIRVLLK